MRVTYQRLGDYGGVMEELSSTTDCVARVGDVVEFEELAASVIEVVWSAYGGRVHVRCR